MISHSQITSVLWQPMNAAMVLFALGLLCYTLLHPGVREYIGAFALRRVDKETLASPPALASFWCQWQRGLNFQIGFWTYSPRLGHLALYAGSIIGAFYYLVELGGHYAHFLHSYNRVRAMLPF